MRAQDMPERERLLAKLLPQPNGCWHWTGVIDGQGYGRVGFRGRRSTPLQQAVYAAFVGDLPPGHVPDHFCHTDDLTCPGGRICMHRRCGNPDHLEAVTAQENISRNVRSRIERCPKAHSYDEENTYIYKGRRHCRACQRAAGAAYKARLRAAAS